jgi:hypothetical protein
METSIIVSLDHRSIGHRARSRNARLELRQKYSWAVAEVGVGRPYGDVEAQNYTQTNSSVINILRCRLTHHEWRGTPKILQVATDSAHVARAREAG